MSTVNPASLNSNLGTYSQEYVQRAMKHDAEADVGPLGSTDIQAAAVSPTTKLDAVAAGSAFAGGAWGGLIEEAEDCGGGQFARMSEREIMARML